MSSPELSKIERFSLSNVLLPSDTLQIIWKFIQRGLKVRSWDKSLLECLVIAVGRVGVIEKRKYDESTEKDFCSTAKFIK